MKKLMMLILALSMLFILPACGKSGALDPEDTQPTTAGTQPTEGEPELAVFKGKIAAVLGETLLLTGESETAGDLYMQGTGGLEVINGAAETLKAGMLVEIAYDGLIMESYPAQLSHPKSLTVVGETDDLMGFYQQIIRDLYNTDPGLNADIEMLVLNLTAVENLSAADQSALLYCLQAEYQLEARHGTYQELVEEGLITDMYFETGLLISFTDMSFKEGSFQFSADKWRSGLGAYFFVDCKAKRGSDGAWSYTIGSEAIS